MSEIASDAYLQSHRFSLRERAAGPWAEHVARNSARERDDVFEEVKRHYTDAELVELTAVCGLFAFANRFNDTLRLPIEDHHEVEKIKISVHADPARIKSYIETLVEYWPTDFPVPQHTERAHTKTGDGTDDIRLKLRHVNFQKARPRVPLPNAQTATGESARFLKAAERLLGGIPNAVRMWANIPYIGKFFLPFLIALEREGAGSVLPSALKALVRIKASLLNAAPYSWAHAVTSGLTAGITVDQISAIVSEEQPSRAFPFSSREHAALLWAQHVTLNTAMRREDVFLQAKTEFNDAEIVELTVLCSIASMLDRMQNALGIPLEKEREIEALNQSTAVDPGKIKVYLETLLRNWPDVFPMPDAAA